MQNGITNTNHATIINFYYHKTTISLIYEGTKLHLTLYDTDGFKTFLLHN